MDPNTVAIIRHHFVLSIVRIIPSTEKNFKCLSLAPSSLLVSQHQKSYLCVLVISGQQGQASSL